MQRHSRRRSRLAKRRDQSPQQKRFFEDLFDTFCQLSEPAQTVLIIGLLLLLGWLLAHPVILVDLVKVILGFLSARAALKG